MFTVQVVKKQYNSLFVLGVVRGQVVPNFLTIIKLADHQLGSGEDNLIEFGNESEEICVERDAGSDALMEVLDVIIGLEDVHVHRETFRPDFLYPEANDVTVVEDDELSAGCWIHNTQNSLPHQRALDWDFVGGQETQGQIPSEN